jgi:DNA-binding MarR family transcriptional regulator
MSDAATQVWQELRSLVLERNDRRREVSRLLDLSFIKVKVLGQLADSPSSMSALAAALLIDAPYASVVVSDLAARGLVVRAPNPDDGRSKLVRLTPAGRRAAESARAILDEPPAALQELSSADLAVLGRITAALLRADPAPAVALQ